MKTAVIFTSQTGFTRKYAEWIAQALQADLFELPEARKTDLSVYDGLIYGGWVSAGSVQGLSRFREILKKVPCRKAASSVWALPRQRARPSRNFWTGIFQGRKKREFPFSIFPAAFYLRRCLLPRE